MAAADGVLTRERALETVGRLLPERFPGADFAFVAGSIVRGNATPSSDIDLVVIHSALPQAYRESLVFENIPVEAFVHDQETLCWFLDADVKVGRPVLISMVAEGAVVGPRAERAPVLQAEARTLLAKGPPPLDRDTLDRMRYTISNMLTDLRDRRPDFERTAIGAMLYTALADFILRSNGSWSGAGKWLPRTLMQFDEATGREFIAAFDELFAEGDVKPVLDFSERVLVRHGGLLFDGYRNDAPAEWRTRRSDV